MQQPRRFRLLLAVSVHGAGLPVTVVGCHRLACSQDGRALTCTAPTMTLMVQDLSPVAHSCCAVPVLQVRIL